MKLFILFLNLYNTCIDYALQCFHNAKTGVLKGQSALEIYGIRRLDWPVCTEFNRRSGDKCARSHDDLRIITGHIPRFWGDKAVNRRCRLYAFTECDDTLSGSKLHRLYDVMS